MQCRFVDRKQEALESGATATIGHGRALDRAFRMRMQFIRGAKDVSDLRAWKSLHFEKLKGDRAGQWSIRLKDQWRLVIEIESDAAGQVIVIVEVVDYH